jgi:hypothetical protein
MQTTHKTSVTFATRYNGLGICLWRKHEPVALTTLPPMASPLSTLRKLGKKYGPIYRGAIQARYWRETRRKHKPILQEDLEAYWHHMGIIDAACSRLFKRPLERINIYGLTTGQSDALVSEFVEYASQAAKNAFLVGVFAGYMFRHKAQLQQIRELRKACRKTTSSLLDAQVMALTPWSTRVLRAASKK